MKLPPGPPLPAPVQTALLTTAQQPFLRACQRRYGDCFTLRVNGLGTLVYLTDPDALRAVFTGPATTFHAGEANQPLGPILGESSLLLLDEDEHLARRKQMLPPFHGDAVRRQVAIMSEVAADDIGGWPVGREFPLLPRTRAITPEVILRTVIGVHDEARLAQLRRVLPPLVEIDGVRLLGLLLPRLRRFWPWNRLRHHRDAADALLLDEIHRARHDPKLSERADVLAMLVRSGSPSDSELRDQLTTLLVAGHETTATGLAWTVERLVRNPDVLARARTAAEEGDDEYLDALVKESLRVRPVVPDVARRLATDAEVAGYRRARSSTPGSHSYSATSAGSPTPRCCARSGSSTAVPRPTPGCRSAVGYGVASAPRSPRWRCVWCYGRCCGASSSRPRGGGPSARRSGTSRWFPTAGPGWWSAAAASTTPVPGRPSVPPRCIRNVRIVGVQWSFTALLTLVAALLPGLSRHGGANRLLAGGRG